MSGFELSKKKFLRGNMMQECDTELMVELFLKTSQQHMPVQLACKHIFV